MAGGGGGQTVVPPPRKREYKKITYARTHPPTRIVASFCSVWIFATRRKKCPISSCSGEKLEQVSAANALELYVRGRTFHFKRFCRDVLTIHPSRRGVIFFNNILQIMNFHHLPIARSEICLPNTNFHLFLFRSTLGGVPPPHKILHQGPV